MQALANFKYQPTNQELFSKWMDEYSKLASKKSYYTR